MAWSDLWALELLLAAFAGGAFGAALGALPAFIFTGFMVIAGEAANLAASALVEAGAVPANELPTIGVTGAVAFGPLFGPHVSFAGGVAAAAYASKRGYMESGFDYHNAKDIAYALGTKPDVLAVGGVFGILGHWIMTVSATLALPWDPIAMGVVVSAIIARVVFGYDLLGSAPAGRFNMKPFEEGERRVIGEPATADGDEALTDGGTADDTRFAVEPWLPHQYKWPNVAMIGLVVGLLASYAALVTGSAFLAFGISAALLVFLNCGVENIPVTHHMSLPASTAALAVFASSGDVAATPVAMLVGAAFGVSGALTGEVIQRVFYAHADTHFDPPAAAIVVNTFFIAVLTLAGVLPRAVWVPLL